MLANGIRCTTYSDEGESLRVSLDCSLEDALSFDDGNIEVTSDDGTVIDVFTGYARRKTSISSDSGIVEIEFAVSSDVTKAIASLGSAVTKARQDADKAINMAGSKGSDPQLQVIARLLAPSIDFASVTATDVVAIPDYIPKWAEGMKLAQNDPVKHKGKIYRASQAIQNTQAIYPPDTAGESLYYPIDVADDGIIIYRTCHGAYDQVKAGELRHYPGATDPVYRAKVDTAYDPVTVPANWELVE